MLIFLAGLVKKANGFFKNVLSRLSFTVLLLVDVCKNTFAIFSVSTDLHTANYEHRQRF
jgi:hypothetical protein